jgi:hypothetical protein
LINYYKDVFAFVNEHCFGYTDLELAPKLEGQNDALKQATEEDIRIKNGTLGIDEARESRGLESIGAVPMIFLASGPVAVPTADDLKKQQDQKDAASQALVQAGNAPRLGPGGKEKGSDSPPAKGKEQVIEKAARTEKKTLKMLPQVGNGKILKHLTENIGKFLKKQGIKLAASLSKKHGIKKAADVEVTDEGIELDWSGVVSVVEPQLEAVYKKAALQSLAQLNVTDEETTNLILKEAKKYAQERSAELIGMKWEGGKLVANADSEYAISETTRENLNALISKATDEGWATSTLSDEILDMTDFSEDRAEMIARTELAFAHSQGTLDAWEESGVVESKESILASGHTDEDDEDCVGNAEAGPIPMDEEFPSGDDGPPYHPNCMCALIAVVKEGYGIDHPEDEDAIE